MAKNDRGGALEQIEASKRELDSTIREQKDLLKEAKKALKKAQSSYDKQIKECEEEIVDARAYLSGPVMTVEKIQLFGDRIIVGKREIPLSQETEVDVSSGGNVYSETKVKGGGTSITGAVVGGVIAGPVGAVVGGRKGVKSKTDIKDERKLFITVISGSDNVVEELDPKKELEARKLAAEVRSQVSTLSKRKEETEKRVRELNKKKEEIASDTAEIDAAKARLDEQERITKSTIDEAKAAHDELKGSFDPEQVKAEKKKRARATRSKILMVCGFVFGAIFALSGIDSLTSIPDGAAGGVALLLLADVMLVKSTMTLRDRKNGKKAGERA